MWKGTYIVERVEKVKKRKQRALTLKICFRSLVMKEKCSIFAVCNKISMRETRRNIAVLGSTGSIGRQTLDIIAEYPDMFNAWLLVARSSADLLIQQARQFRPHMVIIADEQYYEYVRDAL